MLRTAPDERFRRDIEEATKRSLQETKKRQKVDGGGVDQAEEVLDLGEAIAIEIHLRPGGGRRPPAAIGNPQIKKAKKISLQEVEEQRKEPATDTNDDQDPELQEALEESLQTANRREQEESDDILSAAARQQREIFENREAQQYDAVLAWQLQGEENQSTIETDTEMARQLEERENQATMEPAKQAVARSGGSSPSESAAGEKLGVSISKPRKLSKEEVRALRSRKMGMSAKDKATKALYQREKKKRKGLYALSESQEAMKRTNALQWTRK